MKNCHRCGHTWRGFGGQPRPRDVCEMCGAYLHTCANCHHLDHRRRTGSCTLPHTSFIGGREAPNYCEEFRMVDHMRRAREDRVVRAKMTWEALFKR